MIRTLAALAGVLAWLGAVTVVTVNAAAEPIKTAPIPAMYVLAHARTGCGIDRFDELEQARAGRWTDLSGPALGCLLDAVGAPAELAADVVDKSPGYWTRDWATTSAEWSARWQWGPDGYVITIRTNQKDSR